MCASSVGVYGFRSKGPTKVKKGRVAPVPVTFSTHAEGDNDTMITVWNYKTTAQDLVLTLYYSGGHYTIPIHLAARQSYNLDMMSLIRSRVPDPSGTLIPSNITSGSGILSGAGGETDKISVAVAASIFNVRNATCGGTCTTCNGATAFILNPGSYAMAIGGTRAAQAQVTWNTGGVYTNPSGNTWSTASNTIATVNSSSGVLTGKSSGTTIVSAYMQGYPIYAVNCSAAMEGGCPNGNLGDGGPSNVIEIAQNPGVLGMSSGDTGDTLNVFITPASADSQAASTIQSGLAANPNSSVNASIKFNPPQEFNGDDTWTISVSGGISASGIFSVDAITDGVQSQNTSAIFVPPQILLQMMYGEANGTGNELAMQSLGETIQNRFASPYFSSQFSTWQNSLIAGQVDLNPAITTGVQPELSAAYTVFSNLGAGWCGALSWWSPTPSQWSAVQAAMSSGTTSFPSGTGAPTYLKFSTSIEQIVYVPSVGTAAGGQPNFLYLIPRPSSSPAAVSLSCF